MAAAWSMRRKVRSVTSRASERAMHASSDGRSVPQGPSPPPPMGLDTETLLLQPITKLRTRRNRQTIEAHRMERTSENTPTSPLTDPPPYPKENAWILEGVVCVG